MAGSDRAGLRTAKDRSAAGVRRGQRDLRAAGTVLVRHTAGGAEVALVHRPRYDDWSLPKGKLRPDETWPVAAVRETREETGLAVRLGLPVGAATYEVRGRRKEVRYWAATQVGEPGRRIGDEVDDVAWLPIDQALEQLTYDDERAVAVAATQAPPAVTLVIARHAKAVSRKQWRAADPDRPLAKRGNDQAVRLTGLLAAWAPTRVVTSPSRRCVDSVTPYGSTVGSTAELEPLLSEEAHEQDSAALARFVGDTVAALRLEAAALARGIAEVRLEAAALERGVTSDGAISPGGSPPTGAVLCTHRPVLPTIADVLGIALTPADREEALPPAGCWVVHVPAAGAPTYEQHTV